ncbi:mechanosensitive ion channel [Candidatus Kaiserbacteria bacterium]|nr:mechanosensitive ion channel [Candidatus Kaiserbacteria bacterium]
MKLEFFLVARRRKFLFITRVFFLLLIIAGLSFGFLGVYLPAEIWELIIIFLVSNIVANIIRFFTVTSYRKRSLLPVGEQDNFILGIDSVSALFIFFVTVASTFIIFNIPVQAFLTSISVFAVALVLIFKDYISNYLDSFRLMFSADYRIGDYIKVSEFTKGVISDITFRATKLRTDEGNILFIPNTKLVTSEVINYSKTKFKRIIIPFSLPTSSIGNLDEFDKNIKGKLLDDFPDLIQERKMFLRILDIKEWHIEFAFEVSIDQYNFSTEDKIVKAVYECVLLNHDSECLKPCHSQ